ncbi:MAG: hypothetical protein EBU49_01910 [Proteobacteria bacterium]|nr:hypothetical protein [Pseudomonadota bacterium]
MMKIRRAVVMGSGVMGAQIAAVLAAAGVRVHVLDLASAEPPNLASLPKELQKDARLPKLLQKNFRSTRAILAIDGRSCPSRRSRHDQYVRDKLEFDLRRPARALPVRFFRHPLFQSAALHETS